MGTDIRAERDELGRTVGETVWAAQSDDGSLLGAAWEWVEVLQGVPALRDPNGFISNLKLVSDQGSEFDELQMIVGLNRIAHATAWQVAVRDVVGAARSGAASGLGPEALDWSRAQRRIDLAAVPGRVEAFRLPALPANAQTLPRALVA
jgi:hypothetical protein